MNFPRKLHEAFFLRSMTDGTLVESTDCTRPVSWKMGYRNLILRDKTRVSGRGIRQGSSRRPVIFCMTPFMASVAPFSSTIDHLLRDTSSSFLTPFGITADTPLTPVWHPSALTKTAQD